MTCVIGHVGKVNVLFLLEKRLWPFWFAIRRAARCWPRVWGSFFSSRAQHVRYRETGIQYDIVSWLVVVSPMPAAAAAAYPGRGVCKASHPLGARPYSVLFLFQSVHLSVDTISIPACRHRRQQRPWWQKGGSDTFVPYHYAPSATPVGF